MKILHYSLGFSPNRTGGLVKYSTDLIRAESKLDNELVYLSPANWNPLRQGLVIRSLGMKNSARCFAVINSLPLPLRQGIKNPSDFMRPVNVAVYVDFLKMIKPDIIHVHTLMGIHREFFEAATMLSIPIVMTSHDYFGLAPEPNFFFRGSDYSSNNSVSMWREISNQALPTWQLRIFQSSLYFEARPLLRFIKRRFSAHSNTLQGKPYKLRQANQGSGFEELRQYYSSIFKDIDFMLYNSRLAKTVFDANLSSRLSGTVIPITHYDLVTKVQHTKSPKIRVGYIGPNRLYKGFEEFVNLAQAMDMSKFEFHTFGYNPTEQIDHVIQHGRFAYSQIGSVFSSIDILIVPSLWKETFGFVVIEALANHCPVLMSQNVGAKDLVPSSNVYKSLSDLKKKLYAKLDEGTISPLNIKLQSMSQHAAEVIAVYEEVISNGA